MIIPKFKTKVINQELTITQPMKDWLKNLLGDVEVVIKPWKETRSSQQNRY